MGNTTRWVVSKLAAIIREYEDKVGHILNAFMYNELHKLQYIIINVDIC